MAAKKVNRSIILAVSSAGLPFANGYPHQFLGVNEPAHMSFLLEAAGVWLGPRYMLEEDDRFSQVIPYVVAKIGDKVLAYTRAAKGEETRLHGMVSVGAGGHVEFCDVSLKPAEFEIDLCQTLHYATLRELDEELPSTARIAVARAPVLKGLLATRGTPVGDVHVGVVYAIKLESLPLEVEGSLAKVHLASIDELSVLGEQGRLEPWTAALLPFLASF